MKLYVTEILALDPSEPLAELKRWAGPHVPGINFEDAQDYCNKNGLGYCQVIGILENEVECDDNFVPNYSKVTDFEKHRLN